VAAASPKLFPKPGRLIAAGVLALAAGYLFSPVTVLDLMQPQAGLVGRWIIFPGEHAFLRYQHSLYDAPVEEDLCLKDTGVCLTAVRSPSLACLYYYGLGSPRPDGDGQWCLPVAWSTRGFWVHPSELGQRTLRLRGRAYPLWLLAGERPVFLRVGAVPRLWAWCTRKDPRQLGGR